MPKPTSMPLRHAVFAGVRAGRTAKQIARELGLSIRTTEKLVARFRRVGAAAVAPTPAVPPPNRSRDPALVARACALRRRSSTWSAAVIALRLEVDHPDIRPPSDRTVRRWLAKAGVPRRACHGAWREPTFRCLLQLALRPSPSIAAARTPNAEAVE